MFSLSISRLAHLEMSQRVSGLSLAKVNAALYPLEVDGIINNKVITNRSDNNSSGTT